MFPAARDRAMVMFEKHYHDLFNERPEMSRLGVVSTRELHEMVNDLIEVQIAIEAHGNKPIDRRTQLAKERCRLC